MYVRHPETHDLVTLDFVFPLEGGGVGGSPTRGFKLNRTTDMEIKYLEVNKQKHFMFTLRREASGLTTYLIHKAVNCCFHV